LIFLVVGQDQIEEKSHNFLRNCYFWWLEEERWDQVEEEPPNFPKKSMFLVGGAAETGQD